MRMSRVERRTWWRPALAAFMVGISLVTACGESEPEPELPNGEVLSVIELGRLGGEIYNEPERAEQILDGAGLTPEEFEERVRRITNDPLLAREYSRGFEAVARPPLDSIGPDSPAVDTGALSPEERGNGGI